VKDWGAFRAVDDVSFATEKAEFVALLGPSGCGKSTTLRLIAGLDTVTSGAITIEGREVTNLAPARRNLSMVFQSYALFPHLNVADNILFGLSVRGVAKAEQQQRLKQTAELLGLDHLLDRRPSQMSGGQQQRVALGRALISQTPVCLLDEPLSNLDAKLRAGMRSEIRALQKRFGITMVYVTHDQTEAMSMADRVILLNKGGVEQAGAPGDLYEKPASIFVAQFIGTPPMNILDLAAGTGGTVIAGGTRAVTGAAPTGLRFGIRPEHLRLAETGEPAAVQSSEYFGADTILTCRIGSQSLQVRVPGRPGLADGTAVHLAWDAAATHFFDMSSGLRRDDIAPMHSF
jgi:sn-glycerol 3-phosphate transport system ATP-binding protein